MHRQREPGSVCMEAVCGRPFYIEDAIRNAAPHGHRLLAHETVLDCDDARKVAAVVACPVCYPHAWEDTDVA